MCPVANSSQSGRELCRVALPAVQRQILLLSRGHPWCVAPTHAGGGVDDGVRALGQEAVRVPLPLLREAVGVPLLLLWGAPRLALLRKARHRGGGGGGVRLYMEGVIIVGSELLRLSE